jgi:CRISPR/Cas system-associated exonuclease Cas4 (RecB family)
MGFTNFANLIQKEIKESNKTEGELFTDYLDRFIVDRKLKSDKEERIAFRPSSYYKCPRQVWYFFKKFPKTGEVEARLERVFNVGTALHVWVQMDILTELDKENKDFKLLNKKDLPVYGNPGIEFIDEHESADTEIKFLDHRFSLYYPISAMVDGAFHFNNSDYIFEFKTINPYQFKNLKEPLLEHKKQGAIYAMCLGIYKVMFLYLNKANQEWVAFSVAYDEKSFDWVKKRIFFIEKSVKDNILPEREVSHDCNYCPYKKFCDFDRKEY